MDLAHYVLPIARQHVPWCIADFMCQEVSMEELQRLRETQLERENATVQPARARHFYFSSAASNVASGKST